MLRTVLLAVLGSAAFVLPATALAQMPQPAVPTPGPEQIVFVGRVPVAAGTTVTLRAFDLETADSTVCDTATSFSSPDDSADTSSFVLIFEADCFDGAEGAFICWDPEFDECDLVAASPSAIEQYNLRNLHDVLACFSQLGEVVDTGLLVDAPTEPEDIVVPPHGDGPVESEELPAPSILVTAPAPSPDQIVLVGWVPVPPGTSITLRVFEVFPQAPAEFTDCDVTTSLAGTLGREDISEFLLVLDRACLEGRTGAVICWGPGLATDECSLFSVYVSQMGQTFDTGLLAGVGTAPEGAIVPPAVGGGIESGSQAGYGWLLWAGVAALGAGLAVGAAGFGLARRP